MSDRFHMRFHIESRDTPVFVLIQGKNGSKLKPTARIEGESEPGTSVGTPDPEGFPTLPPNYRGAVGRPTADGMFLAGQDVTVSEIAGWLQQKAGRPIVDETGLTGRYDAKMHFEWMSRTPSTEPSRAPSVFTAVDEQLGLKLEAATRPLDYLVIDSMDHDPTEN